MSSSSQRVQQQRTGPRWTMLPLASLSPEQRRTIALARRPDAIWLMKICLERVTHTEVRWAPSSVFVTFGTQFSRNWPEPHTAKQSDYQKVNQCCHTFLVLSHCMCNNICTVDNWEAKMLQTQHFIHSTVISCLIHLLLYFRFLQYLLSASLYFSKRGAYWDRLCRDVVGCHARALWPNGAS